MKSLLNPTAETILLIGIPHIITDTDNNGNDVLFYLGKFGTGYFVFILLS